MSDRTLKKERERSAIFLLHDAGRLVRRDFERRSRIHGMTRAQWQVLASLIAMEGTRQIALAERLDIEPIALVRLIDKLEGAGLVERRADPTDRRARTLHITPAAQPLIDHMRRLGMETRDQAFAGFSEFEREQLMSLLQRLCDNLSERPESAPNDGRAEARRRHA